MLTKYSSTVSADHHHCEKRTLISQVSDLKKLFNKQINLVSTYESHYQHTFAEEQAKKKELFLENNCVIKKMQQRKEKVCLFAYFNY